MAKIQILDKELINLIAAGEVVERPASAVKELLENSIDAGSENIIINIGESGLKSISIKDDGIGMDREDARLSLIQHATSKISSKNDLNAIFTLGFRGEALASISEVSEETIIETKPLDNVATKIIYKEQQLIDLDSTKVSKGTVITINNLFKNIPARKKFLKSDNTELKHILSTFLQIALPYTHIHFEIHHNNKLIYRLTKTNDLKTRIYEIWGNQVSNNLYENSAMLNNLKIEGFVGNTSSGKSSNPLQFVYVNGRFLKSPTITSAVSRAFEGFMHKNLKPTYFLFLNIDPSKIDINIHPRKLEVKFDNEQEIFLTVYKFVKNTLEKESKATLTENFRGSEVNEPNFITPSYEYKSPKAFKINDSSVKEYKVQSKDLRIKEALSFTEEILRSAETKESEFFIPSKVMQVFNTYIIFEKDNKLLVIDQHAAAEKVAFEKLMKSLNKEQSSKPLLVPEIIELSNMAEKNEILEKKESLDSIGFKIDDFGGKAIQITEIPEVLTKPQFRETIEEILHNENMGVDTGDEKLSIYNVSKDIYLIVATIACHGSIRAGQTLTEQEMKQIIKDLLALDNPGNCPHGRPTMWEIGKYEFEKNFKRNI